MASMDLITTYFCKSSQVGYHGNLFGGRMLAWLDEAGLEARRHSVYNGTQKVVCTTDMVFVRIDGDGEAIPISEKVKRKYKHLKYCDVKNTAKKIEI